MWNSLWLRCLQVGFWCRCIWFGFLGPDKFDRTANQEQSCGFWKHVLIVGLLPFIIILITALIVLSNTYNKASWRADWDIWRNNINVFHHIDFLWDLWCLCSSLSSCPDQSETREMFPRTETIKSNSRASKPSNLSPRVQRDNFKFCWAVRNWWSLSSTSNLLEQMYDCQKHIMFPLK